MASYVQTVAAAYALGLAAAAPIGPVNLVSIHRGVAGRWTHTLACGLGSALADLAYCALVLLGGRELIARLNSPDLRDALGAVGAVVLIPLGGAFLWKARHGDAEGLAAARRRLRERPPAHLWTDVGTGALLTLVNPAAPLYWAGAGTSWMSKAGAALGSSAVWWGLGAALGGLLTWFCLLTLLVRFVPDRLGANFFRTVNAIVGLMLVGFGVFCAATVIARLA